MSLAALLIASSARNASAQEAPSRPVNAWYAAGGVLAIAAGLGLGAAGTWAVLRIDDIEDEPGYQRFSDGVPGALDTCAAAREGTPNLDYRLLAGAYLPSQMVAKCDEVDDLVTLEIIAFPTAVILAGLGSYFLLEAFGVGYDSVAVAPIVVEDQQGVAVTARF